MAISNRQAYFLATNDTALQTNILSAFHIKKKYPGVIFF